MEKSSHLDESKEQQLQGKIAQLSQAFEIFSAETERLEKAYTALKKKFDVVSHTLKERTETLDQKVSELDTISNYLHRILRNISQGIIFIGPDGTVTTYNLSAEKILGIPASEILFHKLSDHFSDTFLGFSLSNLLDEKKAPSTSYCTYSKEGKASQELEVTGSYLSSEDGAEGLLLLIRDLTDFKKLQKIANRNDRLQDLGEMAAAVAHEIRNPLGGIEGFASLLMRDLKDSPNLKRMAENIVTGSRTLNHLVSQVLNYARPISMQLSPTSLNTLLKEAVELLCADTRLSDEVEISLKLPKETITVPIDSNVFRRAILNLLINAIQAMPSGGLIEVSLCLEGHEAVISIRDTGEGIESSNLEKIFSPFFTTKTEGNGFGLAEVHKIIQAHVGDISVQSELGKGTCFSIRLPIHHEEASWA